jgi:hypothetical protein
MINFPPAWSLFALITLLHIRCSLGIVIQLNARAEECFFVATESRNGATCQVAWQTQLGATLEIDVDIHDPRESLIYSAIQEPEGQTAFVASEGGRYRVCFSNVNNGQYPKFVAFRIKCTEIPDEHEVPVTPPPRTPFNGTRFCRAFQTFTHRPHSAGRDGDTAQRQNPISYHLLPNLAQKGTLLARCRRDSFFKHLFFCFVLFACVIADAVTDLTTDLSVLDLQLLNIVTEQRLFHSKLKAHRQSMLLPACDDPPHSLLFLRSCRSYT